MESGSPLGRGTRGCPRSLTRTGTGHEIGVRSGGLGHGSLGLAPLETGGGVGMGVRTMKHHTLSQQAGLPTPPPRTAERQRQEARGKQSSVQGTGHTKGGVAVTACNKKRPLASCLVDLCPFLVCGLQAGPMRLESDQHGGCCHCWLPCPRDMGSSNPAQHPPAPALTGQASGGQGPCTHLRGMSTRRSGFWTSGSNQDF